MKIPTTQTFFKQNNKINVKISIKIYTFQKTQVIKSNKKKLLLTFKTLKYFFYI